jgi:hypothetical protein
LRTARSNCICGFRLRTGLADVEPVLQEMGEVRKHLPGVLILAFSTRLASAADRRVRWRCQPLRDKFFVQPVTAVVASPNLSAHKPAGNCASGDDDRPEMPGPCRCGALAQSKGEADGCHRGLWFQSTRFMYGPYEHVFNPSTIRSIEDRPATVVNKILVLT